LGRCRVSVWPPVVSWGRGWERERKIPRGGEGDRIGGATILVMIRSAMRQIQIDGGLIVDSYSILVQKVITKKTLLRSFFFFFAFIGHILKQSLSVVGMRHGFYDIVDRCAPSRRQRRG